LASLKASLALAIVASLATAGSASASVGQNRTDGPNYDRNPSVVQDGNATEVFFARSQQPCNRLAGCDADNSDYDLYVKKSTNGGRTYGPDQLVATNPDGPGPFRGRTIAATRDGGGKVHVFWASGANSIPGLFHVQETNSGWSAPALVPGALNVFNVEALTRGNDVFLYTEECCGANGVYAYRYSGGAAVARTLVSADKNLPKGIVEGRTVRLTYTDATAYPQVDVYVNESNDGLTFGSERLAVSEAGTSHWDPALAPRTFGYWGLFTAPDRQAGAGKQQIAASVSRDFTNWSQPFEITPGEENGIEYWDYWPEPFVQGGNFSLFYTSEHSTGTQPTGVGHIWSIGGPRGGGDRDWRRDWHDRDDD